jgi:hypothetical protein
MVTRLRRTAPAPLYDPRNRVPIYVATATG